MQSAYLFEAKGIQRWVLEGGRLRDIAAASALLTGAARSSEDDTLAAVLAQTRFSPRFSRRAGGAFMLHFEHDQAPAFERFRMLWRLAFMQRLPGLEFTEGYAEHPNDPLAAREAAYIGKARRWWSGRENSMAGLAPFGHALTILAQRTGRPAAEVTGPGERIDPITQAKRAADDLHNQVGDMMKTGATWPDRMDGDSLGEGVPFPFNGREPRIAVVHADISALGRFYEAVGEVAKGRDRALEICLAASTAIEDAVKDAAQRACEDALSKDSGAMPARPVLIGGDDITIILRDDVALPFVSAFLGALEKATQDRLTTFATTYDLRDTPGIAVGLTAGAGIAFGGPKQPFFRLLELAESLCSYAKTRGKQLTEGGAMPPSVVAFYRVTESAVADSAGDLFNDRLKSSWGHLSNQPYGLGEETRPSLPRLDALKELRQAMDSEALAVGSLRSLKSLLLQEKRDEAQQVWSRWRKMAGKRSKPALDEFDKALGNLTGKSAGDLERLFDAKEEDGITSLFDALEWRAVA